MLNIIKQGLLDYSRQRKWIAFNAFFSIFLMLLIGTMLGKAFSETIDINTINISYIDNGTEDTDNLIKILKENTSGITFNFTEVTDLEKSKELVKVQREILLNIEKDEIEVYYSDKSPKEGAIILSTLKSINKAYSSISNMYKTNPIKAMEVNNTTNKVEEIDIERISEAKAPNSYQYYGVAELTLMILYVAIFPLSALHYDREKNMFDRIKLAGVSKVQYYTGRIIASWILSIFITIPGYLFSIFALDTKWGPYPAITFLYLSIFALMVVTLGGLLGFAFKQFEKATMILQGLIIPVVSLLGGSYMALPLQTSGIFNIVVNLSPLRWVNNGVFSLAFRNDWSVLNTSVLINLSLTAIFAIILMLLIRQEEKVYE